MGAIFDTCNYEACSVEELKKKFQQTQDDACYENGSAYSGHIGLATGLTITSHVFQDYNKAENWLSNNAEKWGNALAVKVGDFNNVFPKSESDKKLKADYDIANLAVTNFPSEIIKRIKSGKSLQKTCTTCQSKIAIKYIKDMNCPVCHNHEFLITPTDKKKKESLVLKYNALGKKLAESKNKFNEKNKNNIGYWLVGAVCAS